MDSHVGALRLDPNIVGVHSVTVQLRHHKRDGSMIPWNGGTRGVGAALGP